MYFLLFSTIIISTVSSDVCNTDEGKTADQIAGRIVKRFGEITDFKSLAKMLPAETYETMKSELYTDNFQFRHFNSSQPHNLLLHHFFCVNVLVPQKISYELICSEFYDNNQKMNFTVVRGCGPICGNRYPSPLPVWRHFRFSAQKIDGLFRIFYGHEDYKTSIDYSGNPYHDC